MLKEKEKKKTGQPQKPSKRDSGQSQNVNWRSPTFWPMIDQVVKEQIGRPNLTEIIQILRSRDSRFKLLSHQRLSDWRDKNETKKIVWSKKTLLEVEKGFLPGGNQTRYNIFVSFIYNA